MKLIRAHVQNFRSIVDSGDPTEFQDRVTVLIGKNEQGKTNFLKALASFNRNANYEPADFPNHLRPSLEGKDRASIPVISLWLRPEIEERDKLRTLVSNIDSIDMFKIDRDFAGNYLFATIGTDGATRRLELAQPDISEVLKRIKTLGTRLNDSLVLHGQRLPAFAPAAQQAKSHIDTFVGANFTQTSELKNLRDTLAAALTGLPGQDKPVQDDIAAVIKEIDECADDLRKRFDTQSETSLWRHLPRFILHSATLDRIPNEVNVAAFVRDADSVSRGMANVCRAAGLSIQKINELANSADFQHRATYEDYSSSTISGGINEYWTQAQYNVHFRIERDKLIVLISDDTYGPRIAPSDRSDGFQWYLSFYSTLLSESSAGDSVVLLLDNPGLELHPDGQRDIKRFLEEKLTANTQVVYVTHSPAMVDPYALEQVRKVELHPNQEGTRVTGLRFGINDAADLLEPVRSAIGASLVTSLLVNHENVLVEGAADKPILEGAIALLAEKIARNVVVNGSIAETGSFLPLFYQRSGLHFVVVLDADNRGRELKQTLQRAGVDEQKIILLSDVLKDRSGDFDLEDVITRRSYLDAVQEAYPKHAIAEIPEPSPNKKITRHLDDEFKTRFAIGYCKSRVAEKLKARLLQGKVDDETRTNLQQVVEHVLGRLHKSSQTT